MNAAYYPRKSPILAGFLSIIPGLGQIYNEQIFKGLFILFFFLGSILLLLMTWHGLPEPGAFGNIDFEHFDLEDDFFTLYPLIWILILVPMTYVFAFADAVISARRITYGNVKPAPAPKPTPAPASKPEPAPAASSASVQEPQPAAMEAKPAPEPKPAPNPEPKAAPAAAAIDDDDEKEVSKGLSGRFALGMIMLFIGGSILMQEWHIEFFSWETLWPLIPLIFGLRLLRDYFHDRDRGQFFLGSIFTGIGVIFLIENLEIVHLRPWSWILNNRGLALCVVGVIFLMMDFFERRRHMSRE